MPAIGIGLGIPFNKTRPGYPVTGLDVIIYSNSTYEDGGTTYIRTSLGIGLPVISGTGLDRIIDFAPLNDLRFAKGSYVGNSYGLPEYYNYPYDGIYYDPTSEATRYYWKMTDFAYAVILAQSLLVDNMFFLKATATTDTSNVIASVDRLLIYSVAQTGTNLTKLKTYIGIQDDFYGDNLFLDTTFKTWMKETGWSENNGIATQDGSGLASNAELIYLGAILGISTSTFNIYFEVVNYISGNMIVTLSARSLASQINVSSNTIVNKDVTINKTVDNTFRFFPYNVCALSVKNPSLKGFYKNYYKS